MASETAWLSMASETACSQLTPLWDELGPGSWMANYFKIFGTFGECHCSPSSCQVPAHPELAQSSNASFCIAREVDPEATNPIFEIIFVTHPKTRQNPLPEILFVLRQKYTWIFPVIFPGFPGLFPGFLRVFSVQFFTTNSIIWFRSKNKF